MALTTLTKIGKGVTSLFKAKGATHTRGLEDRFSDTINVKDYGAAGDYFLPDRSLNPNPTDDTEAFKAAILEARKSLKCIYAPSGSYLINERLFFGLLTEDDSQFHPYRNICRGLVGDGVATKIIAGQGLHDDVVIDLSGMRDKTLKSFWIECATGVVPKVGILTARLARPSYGATNNDWGDFFGVVVEGQFSEACYLAASEEESKVTKCRFFTNHANAQACFLSTDNLLHTVPSLTPAKETNMAFTIGAKSNLHQKHTECDYYYGSNSPVREDIGMIKIHGSLMVDIVSPFLNNNHKNIAGVYVEASGAGLPIYGIHVTKANCHQVIKAGLYMVSSNYNCSWRDASSTHGFEEAEIVIKGFTSAFEGDTTYPVKLDNFLKDSKLLCRGDLIQNGDLSAIQNSEIIVGGEFKTTGGNSQSGGNSFSLRSAGQHKIILGAVPSDINVNSGYAQRVVSSIAKGCLQLESKHTYTQDPVCEITRTENPYYNNPFLRCKTGSKVNYQFFADKLVIGSGTVSQDLSEITVQGNSTYRILLGAKVSANINLLLENSTNATTNTSKSLFVHNRYGSNLGGSTISESSTGTAGEDVSISYSAYNTSSLSVNITTNTSRSYILYASIHGLSVTV